MKKVNILGVYIDKLRWNQFVELVDQSIHNSERILIFHANLRAINIAYHDMLFQRVLNSADYLYCDGMGLLLGARFLGDQIPERFTGADWVWKIAQNSSEKSLSLFLLGSIPGVAQRAAERIQEVYPNLRIVGTQHGYFNKSSGHTENDTIIENINESQADILMVGFGMPLQEYWLYENWSKLNVNVAISVGAVFEYISGDLKRGPDWMTQHYLEWLARIMISPARYASRYLHDIPLFALRILRQKFLGLPDGQLD